MGGERYFFPNLSRPPDAETHANALQFRKYRIVAWSSEGVPKNMRAQRRKPTCEPSFTAGETNIHFPDTCSKKVYVLYLWGRKSGSLMREINKDFFTGNRGEGGGEQTPLAHITKKGAVKRLDPSQRDVLLLGRRKTFIEEIHKFRESAYK